jgi:assimilatory nitrate reductase catalytic subunit
VLATPVSSAGDPAHPANLGRLCSKGSALHETLGLRTRLLHPRVDGRRASWDEALDRVAGAFRASIEAHGPDSVALYVSGQLLTEDYYAANKLAKGFLGTANIDSNSRLCMSSAVAGHVRAFGEDVVPVGYADLTSAGLAVLVGSNTAWCHPVLFQRMVAAGVSYVVVDPRRTATCEGAALHLPLRPGSDVALFNGLLAHLSRTVPCDMTLPGAREAVASAIADAPDAAATARACGLDAADVAAFFDLFARTERVVTFFSQGVNQSSSGTDKVNAIINAHLLTGRMGPGAGPFSITGQPNAMGGREVGALSNLLAGHLSWDHAPDREALRRFWGAPNLAARPGRKAVDLFQAAGDGRIRAVWIMGTNPAVSLPESGAVREALRACDFVAVSDCSDGTDTLAYAHVALPALAWGERDGTVTNSERVISRQRPFLEPAGEARADWAMVADVAARLGHGAAFAWRGSHEVFDEHARLTGLRTGKPRVFDISGLSGMSRAEYDAMEPVRWPVPSAGAAGGRVFADGYPTPDGRPRLIPLRARPPENAVSDAAPMALLTGRLRDQWHTMTRTGLSPRLMRHAPEPFVGVHPDDAGDMADGSLATVATAHGMATLRVRLDPGMRRGDLFAPMHWTDEFAAGGRINPAVNPAVDPLSGQPELKHTPARIEAYAATWHGAVLSRAPLAMAWSGWRARWPLEGGVWRHELAGTGEPEAAFAMARDEAGGAGAWTSLRDAGAGSFRAARVLDGALQAVVMVAADRGLPDRDWLATRFAADGLSPADRRGLLAGRAADGTGEADPAVCVCNGVGRGAVLRAIGAGASDVAEIGRRTAAGTGCGSCKPELASLLRAALALVRVPALV